MEKVINHIMELVKRRQAGAGRLKIYVTGELQLKSIVCNKFLPVQVKIVTQFIQ